MTLKQEIKVLSGNKRKFLLLRVADIDTAPARKMCGVVVGTYNSWLNNAVFAPLYARLDEFRADYKEEAIRLLRRDNQLAAVMLEGKIIEKMKAELDREEYVLIKTHLAREVYSKLMADLDVVPQTQVLSWEQRIQQIFQDGRPDQVTEGIYAEGELATNNQQEEQSETRNLIQEGEQAPDEDAEKAQG